MQVFILVNKKQRGPMCLFMPMKSKAKKIYQNFLLGLWLTGFNGQLKQKQKGVRFKTVFIVNEKRLHTCPKLFYQMWKCSFLTYCTVLLL